MNYPFNTNPYRILSVVTQQDLEESWEDEYVDLYGWEGGISEWDGDIDSREMDVIKSITT